MAETVDSLIAQIRDWSGDDAFEVQEFLNALAALDPDDSQGWTVKARAILKEINADMWPGDMSSDFDWWAIDAAYRRVFTVHGKLVFKHAPYPARRIGGTL